MGLLDLSSITLRKPGVTDTAAIRHIARRSAIDAYSYCHYLLVCRDFSTTSIVACHEDALIGFVIGYLQPSSPMVLFASQVAVDPEVNAPGLVIRSMLDTLIDRAELSDISYFETSIGQSNHSARIMFRQFARERDTQADFSILFDEWEFPVEQETEVLCRVGPLPAQRR